MARPPATPLVLLLSAFALGAQAPTVPAGFTVTPVLENATSSIARLKLSPAAKEQPHTHPYPMLIVLLTSGEMEMQNGEKHSRAVRKVGEIEFVRAGVSHHAANVGAMPLEALVIAFKPDRVHGGVGPPMQALPGVTRKPLLDNRDVTVTRVEFEADVREPVHTHPYDVMMVVLTASARLDVQVGDKKQVRRYAVGETVFVPRGMAHTVANVGTASFRALGIAIR
jgi:quercetin dioxygenase-like cupin family protein